MCKGTVVRGKNTRSFCQFQTEKQRESTKESKNYAFRHHVFFFPPSIAFCKKRQTERGREKTTRRYREHTSSARRLPPNRADASSDCSDFLQRIYFLNTENGVLTLTSSPSSKRKSANSAPGVEFPPVAREIKKKKKEKQGEDLIFLCLRETEKKNTPSSRAN